MILASHWQQQSGALWDDGDFNRDGAVNELDATILASNWQLTSGASVPEPASLVLIASAMLAVIVIRRRRLS